MDRLGILGGTFDPIHLAHLLCAEMAREALVLEKVLFVPAGDPPHKQAVDKSSAAHRRTMVELAIAPNPAFELCPVDLERPGPHYSTETVQLVRQRYHLAADDCFFIVGGDSLVDLPTWRNPQELITLCRLAVVHRPGYQPGLSQLVQQIPGIHERIAWVEMPQVDISATQIRQRLREGRSIRYQVLDSVGAYIRQQRLYQR